MVRCAKWTSPAETIGSMQERAHREAKKVRLTLKSCPAQRLNYCRLTQQPTSPKFILSSLNGTSVGALLLEGRIYSRMSQRAEHYRGYCIRGNTQGRGWSVEVHPDTPDLPIFRRAAFRVIHPAWTEVLVEARARVDALLR